MKDKIYDNLYAIVAMTEKTRAIGKDNDMLYHLPEDLKYYKETTMGETIVCGYNTWLSFPRRPLPKRTNIVLSRHQRDVDGAILMHSIEDVLNYAEKNPDKSVFICGGDNVYSQFMPFVSKLYITMIEEKEDVNADSFFPEVDENLWKLDKEFSPDVYEEKEGKPNIRFTVYIRR